MENPSPLPRVELDLTYQLSTKPDVTSLHSETSIPMDKKFATTDPKMLKSYVLVKLARSIKNMLLTSLLG